MHDRPEVRVWHCKRRGPLIVNPTLHLDIEIQGRLRNQPGFSIRAKDSDELRMVDWLLQELLRSRSATGVGPPELPEVLVDRAFEQGLLISLANVPRDEPRFRCELSGEPRGKSWPHPGDPGSLELNPHCELHPAGTLPRAAAGFDAEDEGRAPTRGSLDDEGPVLWFEDPRHGALWPLFAGGQYGEVLEGLVHKRIGVAELPRELLPELVAAGVLLPRGSVKRLRESWSEHVAMLRAELERDAFVVIRELVNPIFMAAVQRHFRALRREGFFITDRRQVPGMRDGRYCDIVSRFIQHSLLRVFTAVLPEPVRPSYTWVFRYRSGAELVRHRDRPQCAWNVSFCADMEPELPREEAWALWLQPDDTPHAARLTPGDCVIYRGTETPHWREPLPENQAYTACFFHYVPAAFEGSMR